MGERGRTMKAFAMSYERQANGDINRLVSMRRMSRSFIIGMSLNGGVCGWDASDKESVGSYDREVTSKGIIVKWSMSELGEFLRLVSWRMKIEGFTHNDVCLFNTRWNIWDYRMNSMRKLMSTTWKTLSRPPVHGRCIRRACDLAVYLCTQREGICNMFKVDFVKISPLPSPSLHSSVCRTCLTDTTLCKRT